MRKSGLYEQKLFSAFGIMSFFNLKMAMLVSISLKFKVHVEIYRERRV